MFDDITELIESDNESETNTTQDEQQDQQDFESLRHTMRDAVEAEVLSRIEDPTFNPSEFSTRFQDLVDLSFNADKSVVIIGAGGLGHPTFKNIIDMGFNNITLIDPDRIDPENVQAQGYDFLDIGQYKVDVLKDWTLKHRGLKINTIREKVTGYDHILELLGYPPDIVISCVDNMELRNNMYNDFYFHVRKVSDGELEGVRNLPYLYIDMRMSAGEWTVFIHPLNFRNPVTNASMTPPNTLNNCKYRTFYSHFRNLISHCLANDNNMIFDEEEGVEEACTARATIFTGYNAASYVGAFLAWYSNNHKVLAYHPAQQCEPYIRAIESWYDLSEEKIYKHYTEENPPAVFKYEKTFNSMSWEGVTKSPSEAKVRNRLIDARNKITTMEQRESDIFSILNIKGSEDMTLDDYRQKSIIYIKLNEDFEDGKLLQKRVLKRDTDYVILSDVNNFREDLLFIEESNPQIVRNAHTVPVGTVIFAPATDENTEVLRNVNEPYYLNTSLLSYAGQGDFVKIKSDATDVGESFNLEAMSKYLGGTYELKKVFLDNREGRYRDRINFYINPDESFYFTLDDVEEFILREEAETSEDHSTNDAASTSVDQGDTEFIEESDFEDDIEYAAPEDEAFVHFPSTGLSNLFSYKKYWERNDLEQAINECDNDMVKTAYRQYGMLEIARYLMSYDIFVYGITTPPEATVVIDDVTYLVRKGTTVVIDDEQYEIEGCITSRGVRTTTGLIVPTRYIEEVVTYD